MAHVCCLLDFISEPVSVKACKDRRSTQVGQQTLPMSLEPSGFACAHGIQWCRRIWSRLVFLSVPFPFLGQFKRESKGRHSFYRVSSFVDSFLGLIAAEFWC